MYSFRGPHLTQGDKNHPSKGLRGKPCQVFVHCLRGSRGLCPTRYSWVSSRLQCTTKETKLTFVMGKYCSTSVVSSQGLQEPADVQIRNFRVRFKTPFFRSSNPQTIQHVLCSWDILALVWIQSLLIVFSKREATKGWECEDRIPIQRLKWPMTSSKHHSQGKTAW